MVNKLHTYITFLPSNRSIYIFIFSFFQTKKLKGVTKKSIFATPDAANGRVGIGTCGIGGKPMTEYTHAEKWRKGT